MPRSIPFHRRHKVAFFVIGACFLFFVFAFAKKEDSNLLSFRAHLQESDQPATNDTLPGKSRKGNAMDDQLILDRQLNLLSVQEAMKAVEERMREVQHELINQDWHEMEYAYKDVLNNVNQQLLQKNAMQALADVQLNYNWLQENAGLENAGQMKRLQRELSKAAERLERQKEEIQMDVEYTIAENLRKASRNLEKAHMEWELLKSFTNDLEKDGLIRKGGKYTIEIKQGDLYINGVKQPDRVVKKYREMYEQYFEGKDGFMLRSGDDRLDKDADLI